MILLIAVAFVFGLTLGFFGPPLTTRMQDISRQLAPGRSVPLRTLLTSQESVVGPRHRSTRRRLF